MAFYSHMNSSGFSKKSSGTKIPFTNTPIFFGRVVHVIHSTDDPYCKDPSMVNGIYYRPLGSEGDESNVTSFPFAYQGSSQHRTLPLVKEVVKLESGASLSSLKDSRKPTTYWKEVVNIWNSPHHNAAPDTSQYGWEEDLLKGFPERKDINPLKANPGDTLIEGRLGQSIRLGNIQSTAGDINSTSPTIIISNGQIQTDNGIDLIEENINEDFNSLYFLSNHSTDLIAANKKQASYVGKTPSTDQYKGNQTLLNAGRIVLNAKEENILLFAKEAIGVSGNTLHLDAENYICLDGNTIFLGEKSLKAETGAEPVLRGNQMSLWLDDLLSVISDLGVACSASPIEQLRQVGPSLIQTAVDLSTKLNSTDSPVKSKKVFVE